MLVDRATFPRDKVCGDGLPPRAVAQVRDLGLGAFLDRYQHHHSLSLAPLGNRFFDLRWPDDLSFPEFSTAIPRFELDAALVDAAVASGAELRTGLRAAHATRGTDGAVNTVTLIGVDGAEISVRCRHLVIADGAGSTLGSQLGRTWHRDKLYGVAGRSYVNAPRCRSDALHVRMTTTPSAAGPVLGYGWAFPLADGRANFGYGALIVNGRKPAEGTKVLNEQFLAETMSYWGLEPPMENYGAAPLALGGATSHIAGPNWLCVGDAAGGTSPMTGEGIDFALESGRAAASLITVGGPYTKAWPALLRDDYGDSLAGARSLVTMIAKHPQLSEAALPRILTEGWMGRTILRSATNLFSHGDNDAAARIFRRVGSGSRRFGPPIFGGN